MDNHQIRGCNAISKCNKLNSNVDMVHADFGVT